MKTPLEPLEVPRFSLAERERRWKRVRQLMERDGLDVLVVPSSNKLTGFHELHIVLLGWRRDDIWDNVLQVV